MLQLKADFLKKSIWLTRHAAAGFDQRHQWLVQMLLPHNKFDAFHPLLIETMLDQGFLDPKEIVFFKLAENNAGFCDAQPE